MSNQTARPEPRIIQIGFGDLITPDIKEHILNNLFPADPKKNIEPGK